MLRELLDAAPRRSPIIVVGARGNPFTESGFRARVFKLIRELRDAGRVAPGMTIHGLRTTTATMLAEAGADTQTIMAITGHITRGDGQALHARGRQEAACRGGDKDARFCRAAERRANIKCLTSRMVRHFRQLFFLLNL